MDQREHRFQGWVDRFLDRVILPPCFITAIDLAGQETMNQRARMQGRGTKFGLPDHYVLQDGRSVWIELKAGSNIPTERQKGVMASIRGAGGAADWTATLDGVLAIVRRAGLRIHGNADNICREITERWQADERARASGDKPVRASKPRQAKPTARALKVAARFHRP